MEIDSLELFWGVGHIYISCPKIIFVDFRFFLERSGTSTKWAVRERKLDTDIAFALAGPSRLADGWKK